MTASDGRVNERGLLLFRRPEHDAGAAGGLEPRADVAGLLAGLGGHTELEHRGAAAAPVDGADHHRRLPAENLRMALLEPA